MSRRESNSSTAEKVARVRSRYQTKIDLSNMTVIPATKRSPDYFDTETSKRVAVYVRVSTASEKQTSSFELQKKYYEEFVQKHSNWQMVQIYADEGISGTSLKKRDAFLKMIEDCKDGKIDLVIVKCISRFARNVADFTSSLRMLANLRPSVGVFFEMESLYSLNDENELSLTLQASMAQEESHVKSRSQIKSYDIRFGNGIFIPPVLLGYDLDEKGSLILKEDEVPTVKLIFSMFLCGYTIPRIADTLMALGKTTMPGNTKWTHASIVGILRNERYIGDIKTRKTYVSNYVEHTVMKNNGERVSNYYANDHDPIIARDDYIAVQHKLDYNKYGNTPFLPELKVISEGILKGYATVNPRWAGFKECDYYDACKSVYYEEELQETETVAIQPEAGDFDLRGFEIARSEFFDTARRPFVSFSDNKIKFSVECLKKFGNETLIEVLVHPLHKKLAIRPTKKDNRNAMTWAKSENGVLVPREIPGAAFYSTLCALFNWNNTIRYRVSGQFIQNDDDLLFIFDMKEPETFLKSFMVSGDEDKSVKPLAVLGKHIKAVPEKWADSFGKDYYLHEQSEVRAVPDKEEWDIQNEGTVYETRDPLNLTSQSTLKSFIKQEIQQSTDKQGGFEHHE